MIPTYFTRTILLLTVIAVLSSKVFAAPILTTSGSTVTRSTTLPTVNLTDFDEPTSTAPQLDWLAYNTNGNTVTKNTGNPPMIAVTRSGTFITTSGEEKWLYPISWTDGTPTASVSNVRDAYAVTNASGVITITIDDIGGDSTTPWVLRLWGYARQRDTDIRAQIINTVTSGVLADTGIIAFNNDDVTWQRIFTFARDPSVSADQRLVVTFDIKNAGGTNFPFQGINAMSLAGIIPEPGALTLVALGLGMILPRRQRVGV